jgi:phosphomecalonate degydratase large subunit
MYLTQKEEKALSGEYGEPLEMAYRVLLAIGRLSDAKKLIPIKWAHVSGVSYLTIGDYGLDFLKRISAKKGTKFKIFTTVNPCGMDTKSWKTMDMPKDYSEKQLEIISSYKKLGVSESFTCIPFESYKVPRAGTHIAWAESSAAIYANSILGLKTNRESAVSALASALTGKTVYSDLHIDKNRHPKKNIRVNMKKEGGLHGSVDFGVLGYYSGKKVSGVIGLENVRIRKIDESKALCAAIGTVGSSGMFVVNGSKNLETFEFTEREYEETFSEISNAESGDAIVFGCPQMTIEELGELSRRLEGKHLTKPCLVFCSSKVHTLGLSKGYVSVIEKSGARLVRDACADFTPLISSLNVGSVETDSTKGAHYMKSVHGVKVALKDTKTILEESAS